MNCALWMYMLYIFKGYRYNILLAKNFIQTIFEIIHVLTQKCKKLYSSRYLRHLNILNINDSHKK